MSADDWGAEDFESGTPVVDTDKWEGEDEGDNVKDAWDAEEEDKKVEESGDDAGVKATQRKKKKPLSERIAEKEAARIEQEKAVKEVARVLSREEKQTEAERLKKIQEEADLKLAKEAFGVDSTGIDAMFPVTDEEFVKFREALKQKITSFMSSKQYSTFVCDLLSELVVDLNVDDLKKISTSTSSLFHEKQKIQKEADKKKKSKKGKGVKLERESDFGDIAAAVHEEDYDDSYYDDEFI